VDLKLFVGRGYLKTVAVCEAYSIYIPLSALLTYKSKNYTFFTGQK